MGAAICDQAAKHANAQGGGMYLSMGDFNGMPKVLRRLAKQSPIANDRTVDELVERHELKSLGSLYDEFTR